MTAIETSISTALGFAVSWALTFHVLPLWGFAPSHGQAMQITAVYTAASFARGFAVRAFFKSLYDRRKLS
tara:strand:+ start:5415 stop:5624 length:210 start_codon:yes stop_codon:yes gene_type:complete